MMAVSLSELTSFVLPADMGRFLALPPPPEDLGQSYSATEVSAAVAALYRNLRYILDAKWDAYDWQSTVDSRGDGTASSISAFDSLFRGVIAYHTSLVLTALDLEETDIENLELLRFPTIDKIITDDKQLLSEEREMSVQERVLLNARSLTTHCGMFVISLMIMRRPVMPMIGWAGIELESLAHNQLKGTVQMIRAVGVETTASWLASKMSSWLALVYAERAAAIGKDYRPGAFSAIHVDELGLLASRGEPILRRYGEKYVEKVFEQQLALIFQSFGFLVVQTRSGTSTVDLVCVSNAAGARVTILVEAKTSRQKYALPKRDSRALRDYVREVEAQLRTLPPLRLVLLVGPEPTRTISAKLQSLEAEIKLPVRYMSATVLGDLREASPAPLIEFGLIDDFIHCERIITSELAQNMSARFLQIQNVHRQFTHDLTDVWSR